MTGILLTFLHECKAVLLSPVRTRRPAASMSRVEQGLSFLVLLPQPLLQDGSQSCMLT